MFVAKDLKICHYIVFVNRGKGGRVKSLIFIMCTILKTVGLMRGRGINAKGNMGRQYALFFGQERGFNHNYPKPIQVFHQHYGTESPTPPKAICNISK